MARTIYTLISEDRKSVLALTNELCSRGAKIISINRPVGCIPTVEACMYEIWFEHELATDPDWRRSIVRNAMARVDKGEVDEWSC